MAVDIIVVVVVAVKMTLALTATIVCSRADIECSC